MSTTFFIDNLVTQSAQVRSLGNGIVTSNNGFLQTGGTITNGQILLGTSTGDIVPVTPTGINDIVINSNGDTGTFTVGLAGNIGITTDSLDLTVYPTTTIPDRLFPVSQYAVKATGTSILTFIPTAGTSYQLLVDGIGTSGTSSATVSARWLVHVNSGITIVPQAASFASLGSPLFASRLGLQEVGGNVELVATNSASWTINFKVIRQSL